MRYIELHSLRMMMVVMMPMPLLMLVENDEQKRINANTVLLVTHRVAPTPPNAAPPVVGVNHTHYFCYIAEKIME